MTAPVEFFFDFASPYGYLASERIEGIASRHGRSVLWRPFGGRCDEGHRVQAASVDSAHRQLRSTRHRALLALLGYPPIPSHWPIATVAACRAFISLPEQIKRRGRLAQTLYRAYFHDDRDISVPETVVAIAAETGFDLAHLVEGIQAEDIKQAVRAVNDEALDRGFSAHPLSSWIPKLSGELTAWSRSTMAPRRLVDLLPEPSWSVLQPHYTSADFLANREQCCRKPLCLLKPSSG